MFCKKCRRYREELNIASVNIRRVELLLESTKRMEESQERMDCLTMLHKHARSNYQDLANINYVMTNCEDVNCTPNN